MHRFEDKRLPLISGAAFSPIGKAAEGWIMLERHGNLSSAAAVLFLLFWDEEKSKLKVVLTLRSTKLATHKGQISFAGGHREKSDLSPEDTALREAKEEIGLNPDKVQVLGRLPFVRSIDGKLVVPVVGFFEGMEKSFKACPEEIEQIIFSDIESVLFENNQPFEFVLFGKKRESALYMCSGHKVWGLTAGIISEAMLEMP